MMGTGKNTPVLVGFTLLTALILLESATPGAFAKETPAVSTDPTEEVTFGKPTGTADSPVSTKSEPSGVSQPAAPALAPAAPGLALPGTRVRNGEEKPSAVLPDGVLAKPVEGVVDVHSTLRVRESPWGNVFGGLKNGDKIKILGISGDFYRIAVGNTVGFVHRRYVSIEGFPSRVYPIKYPPVSILTERFPPVIGWCQTVGQKNRRGPPNRPPKGKRPTPPRVTGALLAPSRGD
ncbi:hypothetical protein AUK22_02725 [bacterium CG2_30_54_10]|nr:MAG: hypothetical protein AUK22_02725 [bacterium CG2_30_54_10]